MARLRASTCYYQYPDLTELGLTMYPRLDSQRRASLQEKPNPSLQQLGKQYVENVREKWYLILLFILPMISHYF